MNREISEKMAQLEIIGELLDTLDRKLDDVTHDYRVVGKEDEQATSWKTGELLWEDEEHTIPKMKDRWENVEIPEDEWSDDVKAKVGAIEEIQEKLKKMI